LSSFFWPPIRDAAVRFSSSLLSNSPCFMILFPLVFNVVFFNRQPIERFFVQLRKISGCQMNFSVLARKRIQEQAIDMFEKPVEFSLRTDQACSNRRFHPVVDFATQTVAKHGEHAMVVHA